MAVWIDEAGTIVRPAEQAAVERSPARDMEIPDGLPDRLRLMLEQVKAIKDPSAEYRAAIVDWVEHGRRQPLRPVARRGRRPFGERARPTTPGAAACFELGQHLWRTAGNDAAVPWWREAHRLFPENWTYKRQAWTFVTTPDGASRQRPDAGPERRLRGQLARRRPRRRRAAPTTTRGPSGLRVARRTYVR